MFDSGSGNIFTQGKPLLNSSVTYRGVESLYFSSWGSFKKSQTYHNYLSQKDWAFISEVWTFCQEADNKEFVNEPDIYFNHPEVFKHDQHPGVHITAV